MPKNVGGPQRKGKRPRKEGGGGSAAARRQGIAQYFRRCRLARTLGCAAAKDRAGLPDGQVTVPAFDGLDLSSRRSASAALGPARTPEHGLANL